MKLLRKGRTDLKKSTDHDNFFRKQKTLPKRTDRVISENSSQSNNISEDNWTPIMEQKEVLRTIDLFHKLNEYLVHQCTVCLEAWPLVASRNTCKTSEYHCLRCSRDKKHPKKFSKENNMIPSAVPGELQGLTQVEEILIECALPIMRVYIKPGGQRGYSGHCINLPQHIEELASSLPR